KQAGLRLDDEEAERLLRHVGLPNALSTVPAVVLASAVAHPDAIARKHALRSSIVSTAIARVADEALRAAGDFVRSLDARCGAEIVESGVVLTGGGALIPGMAGRLATTLNLPVRVPPEPLESVILGARQMLAVAEAVKLWE